MAEHPWTRPLDAVLADLNTSTAGLSAADVKERRAQYGANRLRTQQKTSIWQILVEQFKSLVVGLLVVAAVVSFAFGDVIEGVAIAVVIVINAAIGFFTELRAVRSMEALRELSQVDAKVRRDGRIDEVPAEKLVPGDIVILEGGDVITADLRLLEASKLQTNESALTGESVPVSKQVEPLEGDIPLAERANMVYKGTSVTRGSGEGVVIQTGMETELGQISSLVQEAEQEATPLEKRLDLLGRRLILFTLVIATLVAVAGIITGKEIVLMIETSIALAVASIPEGLPIVATVALARGMRRMARRNALVSRLSAVETLGATSIILTDKTGTLTENRMMVTAFELASGRVTVNPDDASGDRLFTHDDTRIALEDDAILRQALEVGVLCNNASLKDDPAEAQGVGDPLEVALLVAGARADIRRAALLEEWPETREEAFDPDVKMMATFHAGGDGYRVVIKGAPDAVLDITTHVLTADGKQDMTGDQRQQWHDHNQQMATEGLRVLALAQRTVDASDVDPYHNAALVGLVGLADPPREDVRPALEACKSAGIRVVMVTGDQAVTARNIAQAVGLVEEGEELEVVHGQDLKDGDAPSGEERQRLVDAPIFARVNPKQKLDLIALHQSGRAIVAMTGDGVNDAPALKKADIGVAMGQRGTQVATEAADMVLKDDAFSTIVVAVEQGRVIFNNIRRFVLYLLSCNISEVMVVGLASIVNAPLPIRPLQILFLNLVTDVFPALALGVGEGDPTIMDHPPRDPDESILTRQHWLAISGYGALITAAVLGVFALSLVGLDMDEDRAVTVSFLTLALAQLWHVFNMRDRASNIWRNDITRNPYVWGALVLCTVLLLLATYVPGVNDVLGVVDPKATGWAIVLGFSVLPLLIGQIVKEFLPESGKQS
ncbi:MAG: cation-transporting P-type ATPase [Chloroflexi bacterium]|nr:cation-transporting P-type ATPase [Chloroflexota bacterium]